MEFRDYLDVLRSRWLSIAVCTLVVGAVAYLWSDMQPRVYSTSAEALVTPAGSLDEVGDAATVESRMAVYTRLATSDQVAAVVAESIGGDADALRSRISVSGSTETAIMLFTGTGSAPESAQELVNAWMDATFLVVSDVERTSRGISNPERTVINVMVLQQARLPSVPASPAIKQNTAVGLMLGLALGVAYAFVRATLDRRLRSRNDVEIQFGVPVVGTVPWDGAIAKKGPLGAVPGFAFTEAMRQLRTNLQFMNVDHPPRVLVVTSPVPGDGKSTMAVMLAAAIAESGRDVVLVDADLRRPTLAKALGVSPEAGLTSVLASQASIEEVTQQVGDSGRFSVVTAGVIPPNPSELVGSDTMRSLLYSFPEDTMVIVDSPPLVPVSDAAVLAARTDGALVVARAGATSADMLEEALRILDRVQGRALGVILDGVAPVGPRVKHYGYGNTSPGLSSLGGAPAQHDEDDSWEHDEALRKVFPEDVLHRADDVPVLAERDDELVFGQAPEGAEKGPGGHESIDETHSEERPPGEISFGHSVDAVEVAVSGRSAVRDTMHLRRLFRT
ncbi:polysaccharide biosynthesis tyrosine autokinase [Demequina mangrovi]|uniref:Capsular exopolysaccharide family n=1 Tax=Demequina mangrovi TaxID=1043493 RepID=A0A1H6YPK1_9MICO|nr:polysaccharide biosynthesis tyrosine autokinase [Demequina mangrovi]SEJ40847.1 capsular exopolysaccharide family [Demequina mangrovi]